MTRAPIRSARIAMSFWCCSSPIRPGRGAGARPTWSVTCQRLSLRPDQTVVTIERHANTSAASIPLALDEAVSDGRIQPGHLVLMEALGGGLTWGASLVRW